MRKADFLSISQSFCSFIFFFVLHPSYSCCFGRFTPWSVHTGMIRNVLLGPSSFLDMSFLVPSSKTNFLCIVDNHHFFMRDYYLIEHESASIFQMTKQQVFVVKNLTIFPSSLPECHPQRGSPWMPQFHPRQVKWNCAKPKRPWGTKNAHRRSIKRPLLVVRFVSLVVDGVISHFKWLCRLNRET